MIEKVKDIDIISGRESCLLVISERMRGGWWSGGTRGGINNGNGIVCLGDILDICIVRRECLRVILLSAVLLLMLPFSLFLFIELALVFLVFCYA